MKLNWTEVKKDVVIAGLLIPIYFAARDIRSQIRIEDSRDLEKIVLVSNIPEKTGGGIDKGLEEENLEHGAIKQVLIKDFLADYLDKVTLKSNDFKKLRKKYGKEGLLERCASVHEICFELAYENQGKNILDKQYEELGLQIAKKQQDISRGISHVNNLDKGVVKVYERLGRNKTELFIKLIEASKEIKPEKLETEEDKQDYVRTLLNSVYSREDYIKYIKNFNNTSDELCDALYNTLDSIEKFFSGKQMDRIAKCTREVQSKTIDDYFPKVNSVEERK